MLNPETQFTWGERENEAWMQARNYILQELTNDSEDNSDEWSGSGKDINETRHLTGADLQNLGITGTKPEKFMTPGAMSEAKEDATPPPQVIPNWPCNPPPSHHFCNVPRTPGGMNPPTYGLSEEALTALGITLPITTRIRVRNLAYGVNEAKLREVFSMSGKMIEATLHRNDAGEPKGTAAIEYAHPLGAIQAIKMFRDTRLFSRKLIIEQDKLGPDPIITGKLPDGLTNVKEGLGPNGSRLKVCLPTL